MRPGKITESVLKRSVLKQIKTKREEVLREARVGEDCAFLSFSDTDFNVSGNHTEKKKKEEKEQEGMLLTTAPVIVDTFEEIETKVSAIINNIAAAGGEPAAVMVSAMLPDKILESTIQRLSAQMERACGKFGIQIAGGNTEITKAVTKPILNLTIIGKKDVKVHQKFHQYKAGQDIILTKWIGLAGTSVLAKKYQEKLGKRLPAYIVEDAVSFENKISVLPESRIAMQVGTVGMHDVSRGGIFAALWELAERGEVGIEVDLKKIPVRQETIEVCEILEVNPYELYGAGSLLIVSDKGNQLLQELEKQGIEAAIIGKIAKDNGRVVINGEEIRFLDRPKTDSMEIFLRDELA